VTIQDRLSKNFISLSNKDVKSQKSNPKKALVVKTCKEYKNILLDYPLIVVTDHKNNIFNGLNATSLVVPPTL
jgi:hypothetical protein